MRPYTRSGPLVPSQARGAARDPRPRRRLRRRTRDAPGALDGLLGVLQLEDLPVRGDHVRRVVILRIDHAHAETRSTGGERSRRGSTRRAERGRPPSRLAPHNPPNPSAPKARPAPARTPRPLARTPDPAPDMASALGGAGGGRGVRRSSRRGTRNVGRPLVPRRAALRPWPPRLRPCPRRASSRSSTNPTSRCRCAPPRPAPRPPRAASRRAGRPRPCPSIEPRAHVAREARPPPAPAPAPAAPDGPRERHQGRTLLGTHSPRASVSPDSRRTRCARGRSRRAVCPSSSSSSPPLPHRRPRFPPRVPRPAVRAALFLHRSLRFGSWRA